MEHRGFWEIRPALNKNRPCLKPGSEGGLIPPSLTWCILTNYDTATNVNFFGIVTNLCFIRRARGYPKYEQKSEKKKSVNYVFHKKELAALVSSPNCLKFLTFIVYFSAKVACCSVKDDFRHQSQTIILSSPLNSNRTPFS